MDNQGYMLCEFPNEENSISIGYLEWLENKYITIELDDIIKHNTVVNVRWPKGYDVSPATVMKKKLANCQWEIVAAKLLAYGGWIKMREIRDNLEKYGITELNKYDRKQFTRKQIESDSEELEIKEIKKGAISKQKKCILNVKKGKELLKQYKHKKQKYLSQSKSTNSDNEYDEEKEESLVHKQSKPQLANTVTILKKENERLRRDNQILRKLKFVNEDSPTINKILRNLTVDLQSALLNIKSVNHEVDQLQQKVQKISNCIIKCEQRHASPTLIVQNKKMKLRDLPSDKLKSSQSSATEFCEAAPSRESIPWTSEHNLVPQNQESLLENFPDTPDVEIKEVKSLDDEESIAVHEPEIKTVDLGGPKPCTVNATRLFLCNHTSISKLTCDLMSLLFSKKELATSSLTGTVANFHYRKGVAAKKNLDDVKIEAMRVYIKNKFPVEEDFEKIFRKAIQQKCNNAIPRTREKKKLKSASGRNNGKHRRFGTAGM